MENLEKFILRPSVDMWNGMTVHKDTELEYQNENVEQSLKDLVFKTKTTINQFRRWRCSNF